MRLTEQEFIQIFGKRKLAQVNVSSKYRNKECVYKGIKFPSLHEMYRYIVLEFKQNRGEITDLNRQVRFQLLPAQKDENGKVIERPTFYVADFTYRENGNLVVEDAKGMKTQTYILKRKMMLWFHGIRIKEV